MWKKKLFCCALCRQIRVLALDIQTTPLHCIHMAKLFISQPKSPQFALCEMGTGVKDYELKAEILCLEVQNSFLPS